MATKSITTEIEIFCAEQVDITVRLIIVSAQKIAIKISAIMCGQLSKITILGMTFLAENQFVTLESYQIHCGQQTESRFFLQGLLTDKGSLYYQGLISIQKDASGTYALQNNKNILLSSTASVISIPNIEVLNYDVQCYHGSAVGQFLLDQMEYMQARGLSQSVIKSLLVQALFADVLDGYKNRDFILQKIYESI